MRYTCSLLGRNGRLGNQLFQMAGTLGRAHRSGDVARARFPLWRYRRFFSIPDVHFEPLEDGERVIDIGRAYMQNLDEFGTCARIIRDYFAPSELARQLASETHPTIGPADVSMHVRRGDYLTRASTHPAQRASYFRRAAALVRQHRAESTIHVFSDDPTWCTEHLGIADISVHVPSKTHSVEENEVADLVAMSRCGAHIISNSTFGWWGAWLAHSPLVFYPDPWFGPGLSHLDPAEFIPPDWKPVDTAPAGPLRVPGLVVEETPTGLVVADPVGRRVHHLNPAAAVVFEYCTGDNSELDIGRELAVVAPDLDWVAAIRELRRIGIVTN